ncbi:MAG: mechanosensitive ion channel family protein [Verrucomicrobia bacterium]|nr:mechanosensitive ion channel family protein [Verrucomicrobiota bacterium]
MKTPSWTQWILKNPWIAELFIILTLIVLLNFVLKRVLIRSKKRAHIVENDWRVHLDYIMVRPLQLLLWIFLIAFSVDIIIREFEFEGVFLFFPALRDSGIVVCLAWLILRWKKVFHDSIVARRIKGKSSFDLITLELINKLFTIAVLFIVLMLILQILGLNIVPLLTFGGIGAATLAFASRDVFANFFGGLMLNLTRPFTVNDQIEMPHRKVTGYVEEIGWYLTVIRDLQKRPIYMPNSIFSSEILINLSRITHRRIEEMIGLRYVDIGRAEKIVDEIRQLLTSHTNIDQTLPLYVYLYTLAPSSVDIEVKAYSLSTRYEDFMEIKQKVLLEIYQIISRHNADLAFPTITIDMPAKY